MDAKPMQQLRLVATTLAAGLLLTCGLYGLSRSPAVTRWIFHRNERLWRVHEGRCSLAGPYMTLTDRVLLDDVFRKDFARKRVYMIGGCLTEELVNTNHLTAQEREGLSVLAMPGYNFIDLRNLVAWLSRDHGFGARFGPDTLIVVGLDTDLAGEPGSPSPKEALLTTGLYDYRDDRIITPRPLGALAWRRRLYRLRVAHFLNKVWNLRPHLTPRRTPVEAEPELKAPQLAGQMEAARELLEAFKGTGARVEVVMTPNASWLETPLRVRIREQLSVLCRAEGLHLTDLSRSVADGAFLDVDHMAYEGQQITSPRLLPLVRSYLAHNPGGDDAHESAPVAR